jgi:hypothetical protein
MTLLIAASLQGAVMMLASDRFHTPLMTDGQHVGAAVYYSAAYDDGGWDRIIDRRIAWGQLDADTIIRDGMYCVNPASAIGDRLHVMNLVTGTTITCTVVDAVAPRDLIHWRAEIVIEMSYAAFVAADGTQFNRFVVWYAGSV